MSDPFVRLVAEQARANEPIGPQLGFSMIAHNEGALTVGGEDGTVAAAYGTQFDGSHGAFTLNGPKPATPAAPTLTAGVGTLTAHSSGGYVDPELRAPLTFGLRQVHASREPVFTPGPATLVGSITDAAGGSKTFAREPGTWYVGLVEKSNFGRLSDLSETVAGAPLEVPRAEVNDGTAPPVLAAPTVTDWLGQLYVASDGLGAAGEPMPEDYTHSIVESAPAATGPWTAFDRIIGEGSVIPLDIPYETETWFRLRSVDQWGNTSDPSAAASGTTHRLVGGDLADETISAGKLNTNQIWADAGWLGKARIGVLNFDTAEGGSIHADDIEGITLTGALIQTMAELNRGIKLDSVTNTLQMWDPLGVRTLLADGDTGNFFAIGTLATDVSGSRVELRDGNDPNGSGIAAVDMFADDTTAHGALYTMLAGGGGGAYRTVLSHYISEFESNVHLSLGADVFQLQVHNPDNSFLAGIWTEVTGTLGLKAPYIDLTAPRIEFHGPTLVDGALTTTGTINPGALGVLSIGTNLNNYTSTGVWHQDSNADAGDGFNYPEALAGVLEVYAQSSMVYQRYTTYNSVHRTYVRTKYGSTWYAWSEVIYEDDTGWIDIPTRSPHTWQGGIPPQIRRIGKVCYMSWGWSNAGMSSNATFDVGTIPVGFRPPAYKYFRIGTNSANNPAMGVIWDDGTVEVRTGSSLGAYFLFDGITWIVD